MTVQELYKALTTQKRIKIRGVSKIVTGLARYATVNNPLSEYIKVSFEDGSGIYFGLEDEAVFYFDKKLLTAEGITDEMIGRDETITWNSITFTATNPNDYQYVKEFIIGNVQNHEGEVKFSDYEDENGNVLSLGWNMFEGTRDDVYAVPLPNTVISQ